MVFKVKKYNQRVVRLVAWYVKNTGDRSNSEIAKYLTQNNINITRTSIIY